MPFEFTGEKPAWQTSSAAVTNGFGFDPAAASATISTSQPAYAANAATHTVTGDNDPSYPPSTMPHSSGLVFAEKAALEQYGTDDVLMQALKRGINDRPAAFGHQAVVADKVLQDFVRNGGLEKHDAQLSFARASRNIRSMGKKSEGKKLVEHLLAEVIRLKSGPSLASSARPEHDWGDATTADSTAPTRGLAAEKNNVHHSYAFAVGSAAYDAITQDAEQSRVLRGLLETEDERHGFAERIVSVIGNGYARGHVEHLMAQYLPGHVHDEDTSALVEYYFFLAHREVVIDKRDTRAPELQKKREAESREKVVEVNDDSTSMTLMQVTDPGPFRLFDLPPELRMSVYRELLSPGYIMIGEENDIATGILRVSKQVYKEAGDLLYHENIICISVRVSWGNLLMRSASFSRLKKVLLIIDMGDPQCKDVASFKHVDWRQMQGLTGLQEVRIAVVEGTKYRGEKMRKRAAMEQVIERIPAGCRILYGPQSKVEKAHVEDYVQGMNEGSRGTYYHTQTFEVEAMLVEECAMEYLGSQGVKCGHERDYRFPERKAMVLKPLVAEGGEVDRSVVLGS